MEGMDGQMKGDGGNRKRERDKLSRYLQRRQYCSEPDTQCPQYCSEPDTQCPQYCSEPDTQWLTSPEVARGQLTVQHSTDGTPDHCSTRQVNRQDNKDTR